MIVTGASTGIGEAIAIHLAGLGYRVLAGVRNPADAERMSAIDGIEAVTVDVTDEAQIAALVEFVDETEPNGLYALVNNAGVGMLGPVESLPVEQWRWVMDVNVIGTVAMTRAFLPSLLRRGGRVVNIGSGGGRVAFPLFGPYAASKFAMEAFTDVLRREIAPHGVKVVCVQPGVVSTPIYAKSLPSSYERTEGLAPDVAARYQRLLDSAHSSAEQAREEAPPASIVAPAVAKALGSRQPRTRYVVGWDSRTAVLSARFMPDRFMDFVIRRLTAN